MAQWHPSASSYGLLSKLLHWLTVLALAAQFAVGWTMDLDDCDPPGEDLSGGDLTEAAETELDRIEDACEASADRLDLIEGAWGQPEIHVALGVLVLALVLVRLAWRRWAGLPEWSDHLSARARRRSHVVERLLLTCLVLMPASGIVLVALGNGDWVWLHVGSHVVFLAALAVHIAGNVRPVILRRML